MADYCKQCSEFWFGQDYEDAKGLSTEENTDNKLYAMFLCEGCGATQVDHTGMCIHHNLNDEGHKECESLK